MMRRWSLVEFLFAVFAGYESYYLVIRKPYFRNDSLFVFLFALLVSSPHDLRQDRSRCTVFFLFITYRHTLVSYRNTFCISLYFLSVCLLGRSWAFGRDPLWWIVKINSHKGWNRTNDLTLPLSYFVHDTNCRMVPRWHFTPFSGYCLICYFPCLREHIQHTWHPWSHCSRFSLSRYTHVQIRHVHLTVFGRILDLNIHLLFVQTIPSLVTHFVSVFHHV